MDYLLEDRREVVEDVMLDVWGQSPPDGGWMSGHNVSHSPANAMSSWAASLVSLVGTNGWDEASVVAASGMRKTSASRYPTSTWLEP
jgi:hypothetical protein